MERPQLYHHYHGGPEPHPMSSAAISNVREWWSQGKSWDRAEKAGDTFKQSLQGSAPL